MCCLRNIRVHYMNGRSSSVLFTPPKEKQSCTSNCETCNFVKQFLNIFFKNKNWTYILDFCSTNDVHIGV